MVTIVHASPIHLPGCAMMPGGAIQGAAVAKGDKGDAKACPQEGQNCASGAIWVPHLWQNMTSIR